MYLHKIFKPKKEYELTRLGKKNDGGYLVGIQTVKESQYLISFGIRDDWSFEKDFLKKNFVKAICCLLYTSPSPRDTNPSRMPSSA